MDTLSTAARSRMMSGIKGKNTKPELLVRRAAHALGYRFRLHRRDLPGSPDLVFPSRKLCLFVHGCYWHRHEGCKYCYEPKSNVEFWAEKFRKNVERDKRVQGELEEMGWKVAILWECQVADPVALEASLRSFLGP